jgi:hypothetical protein
MLNVGSYKAFFKRVSGHDEPFDYQLHIAEKLFRDRILFFELPPVQGKRGRC